VNPNLAHGEVYSYNIRGFKDFYNRRYFLNFRRYLKNEAEGRKGSRGRKLLKSSILWTKKCTSETAKHFQHFVDQKMYFRDYKTLSVFERKIPLTLEFRFHQE
jgi:hypothetical protein